jgi:hypothetical protein
MPHVTFVHGIGNKPAPETLLRDWRGALTDHGLDLGDLGVSTSMVYWADLLYSAPVAEVAYERAGAMPDPAVPDIGMGWVVAADGAEAQLIQGVAAAIGFDELASDAPVPPDPGASPSTDVPVDPDATAFERVPLPGWLKRRLMKILLRDVHHYLFDAAATPRPGETYRVQQTIRARVVDALGEAADQPGPHIVVSHSMGTVIAYDCLKRVDDCPPVDGLMTIGSPLGLDDVQAQLKPQWTRADGFPAERLHGEWVNVFDRLDPVAAFDPDLADDYRHDGVPVVDDLHEPNWGRWRHSIDKYFAGAGLRDRLAKLLGVVR